MISGNVLREIDEMASETMRSRAGMIRWLLNEATMTRRVSRAANHAKHVAVAPNDPEALRACGCYQLDKYACAGLRQLEEEACLCECHAK